MKLILSPPVDDHRLERITAAAQPMQVVNCATEADAIAAIADADAMYGKLTPAMLVRANNLRWVQTATVSLEHYIFPELVQHPCTLTNMRGLYSDVVADHVMGYVLMFARNLHRYLRQQLQRVYAPIGGEAARSSFAAGQSTVSAMDRAHIHLSDCTLGVVGLGHIGSEIARRAAAFSMRVLAVDPARTDKPDFVESLWPLDRLSDLTTQSDFTVIAAPHTPQTEKMFRRAQFRRMNPQGYLINIGRGAIVNLNDLCDALEAKELAGAALDVFEKEPLPADHRLWGYENVILTPHVAACSVHIAERHLELLLDNISRFVRGQPLRNIADKAAWF